jgi:hypothetical protein
MWYLTEVLVFKKYVVINSSRLILLPLLKASYFLQNENWLSVHPIVTAVFTRGPHTMQREKRQRETATVVVFLKINRVDSRKESLNAYI